MQKVTTTNKKKSKENKTDQVHPVALCSGTNIQRKQREMRLIFQLGTIRPKGLNINFSLI